MGKKKATKSRKLRPLLERHIASGEIYCKGRASRRVMDLMTGQDILLDYDTYDITFGGDKERWYDEDYAVVCVTAKVYDDGEVKYDFYGNTNHMLSREHDRWFLAELEQIITMHKLGAFESERAPLSNTSALDVYAYYSQRGKKRKKK